MSVLEKSYNPVSISTVTQSPAAGAVYDNNSVILTATLSSAASSGEYVYLRWSTNVSFTTSNLVQMNATGTTASALISCQSSGATIYYYVYSSNRTSAAIFADEPTYGQSAHDLSTLNLNNNGGPNYQYTVNAATGSFCGIYSLPSSCYPTVSSFVSALNSGSVSCAVTCYIAAAHSEIAPAGGINLTQTGTSSNPISFIKNGKGANPVIYAQTGTVVLSGSSTSADGIFSLNGSDYITIDGIDLFDNNTSGAARMEYGGYALFKSSAPDGCQNNTIKNCAITLKATNISTGPSQFEDGSRGIFAGNITRTAMNSALTITTASGRNDNNIFAGNVIKNVHHGIVVRGYWDIVSPYTYYDQNNKIGQPGAGKYFR